MYFAVVTQFNAAGSDEVVIKARGRSISTAVDTARNCEKQVCHRCNNKRDKNWNRKRPPTKKAELQMYHQLKSV